MGGAKVRPGRQVYGPRVFTSRVGPQGKWGGGIVGGVTSGFSSMFSDRSGECVLYVVLFRITTLVTLVLDEWIVFDDVLRL